MHPDDQENTLFMTEREIYYNKIMSFGLKNVVSTYQKLVKKMFKKQIGRTMEVYIGEINQIGKPPEAPKANIRHNRRVQNKT